MVLNKKGIFFTLIAIALLSIVAISFIIISLSHERDSIKKRVGTLNDYVLSVEEDITRKIYISGYRIIFILEKRIIEEGNYVSNTSKLFNEAFFNGTINGTASTEEQQLLSGVQYQDILDDLSSSALEVNLNLNISNPSLKITQVDPWNVLVRLNISIYMEDRGGLASWNRTGIFESFIPIENFEDPIYLINTNGLMTNKFRKSPYLTFVDGSDFTNLNDHLNNSYYFATNESPSFLNRLEGNFSASEYGVESFVNTPRLTTLGITVKDKSVVDHIYFSSSNPTTSTFSGAPSWFKIDDEHAQIYGLS